MAPEFQVDRLTAQIHRHASSCHVACPEDMAPDVIAHLGTALAALGIATPRAHSSTGPSRTTISAATRANRWPSRWRPLARPASVARGRRDNPPLTSTTLADIGPDRSEVGAPLFAPQGGVPHLHVYEPDGETRIRDFPAATRTSQPSDGGRNSGELIRSIRR